MQKVEPTSIYGRPIENIYISESIFKGENKAISLLNLFYFQLNPIASTYLATNANTRRGLKAT